MAEKNFTQTTRIIDVSRVPPHAVEHGRTGTEANDDFSRHHVVLVTRDDCRLAQISDAPYRHEQSCDGPQFLVIRPNASDECLATASARFGVMMHDLTEFRETRAT